MPIAVSTADAAPDAPYVGLELDLDLDLARRVIAEVDLDQLESPTADPCLAIGELNATLLDAVLRLVRLIETPSDMPILGQLIQREILYRLAIGPKGSRLRQIVSSRFKKSWCRKAHRMASRTLRREAPNRAA